MIHFYCRDFLRLAHPLGCAEVEVHQVTKREDRPIADTIDGTTNLKTADHVSKTSSHTTQDVREQSLLKDFNETLMSSGNCFPDRRSRASSANSSSGGEEGQTGTSDDNIEVPMKPRFIYKSKRRMKPRSKSKSKFYTPSPSSSVDGIDVSDIGSPGDNQRQALILDDVTDRVHMEQEGTSKDTIHSDDYEGLPFYSIGKPSISRADKGNTEGTRSCEDPPESTQRSGGEENASKIGSIPANNPESELHLVVKQQPTSHLSQHGSTGEINAFSFHVDSPREPSQFSDNPSINNQLSDVKLSSKQLSDNQLSDNQLSGGQSLNNQLSDVKLSSKQLSDNQLSDNQLSGGQSLNNQLSGAQLSDGDGITSPANSFETEEVFGSPRPDSYSDLILGSHTGSQINDGRTTGDYLVGSDPGKDSLTPNNSVTEIATRQGGGTVHLSRIKCLVSMTTPRDMHLCGTTSLPGFVEFNMSLDGFGCLFFPSIAPHVPPGETDLDALSVLNCSS